MLRKSKMKEKQNWASEKPKLENARRLTGIYFIEPEDKEFKEIIKNPWKSWKSQPHLQCLVKGQIAGTEQPVARMMITSPKFACILEAEETKRQRMERIALQSHEDHMAGKGSN